MKITLPNNKTVEVENGKTPLEILKEHYPRALKDAIAVRVDGVLWDLNRPLQNGGKLEVITFDDEEGR